MPRPDAPRRGARSGRSLRGIRGATERARRRWWAESPRSYAAPEGEVEHRSCSSAVRRVEGESAMYATCRRVGECAVQVPTARVGATRRTLAPRHASAPELHTVQPTEI